MKLLKVIHWVIIINFILEIFYGGYMVFRVVGGGGGLPLFGKAAGVDFETMVTRRLYAIETWVAIAGLSVYVAITEIYPKMRKAGG